MFNPPYSKEEYNNHPASNTSFCDPITDIHVSSDDVRRILLSLDVNKATGPDRIPARLLQHCAPYISSSLSNLVNKSLNTGKVPSEWKISNITPIPKGGQKNEASNYRPISLLSIVSKVLERCIYNQLVNHLSNQLHNLQFRFLKGGKSTTSQLLQVLHKIGEKLDKGVQTDILYLDFTKAFDRADHQLLVKKLRKVGIGGNLLIWFENYLLDCHQQVTKVKYRNQCQSCQVFLKVQSLVYYYSLHVYVNDLLENTISSSVALFADDTKCYRAIRTTEDVKHLQCDLERINEWCWTWRMNLNQSKSGLQQGIEIKFY